MTTSYTESLTLSLEYVVEETRDSMGDKTFARSKHAAHSGGKRIFQAHSWLVGYRLPCSRILHKGLLEEKCANEAYKCIGG